MDELDGNWRCGSCGSVTRSTSARVPLERRPRTRRRTTRAPGGGGPEVDELIETLRRPTFPLYGLPSSWTGDRYLAGWDLLPGALTGIGLGHRNESVGSSLIVHIAVKRDGRDLAHLSDRLAESLHREVVGEPRARIPEGGRDRKRTKISLNLDGESVRFECVSEDGLWVMYGEHGGMEFLLRGRNLPPDQIELVRLPHAGQYLESFVP
jgi:hypothetical protein